MIEKARLCPFCLMRGRQAGLVYDNEVFSSGKGFLNCRECNSCLPSYESEQEALSENMKLVEELEKGGKVTVDKRFLCPYCLINGRQSKMDWGKRYYDAPPREWLVCRVGCLATSPCFATKELVLEANGRLVEAVEKVLEMEG